jgi:hypothetical protein
MMLKKTAAYVRRALSQPQTMPSMAFPATFPTLESDTFLLPCRPSTGFFGDGITTKQTVAPTALIDRIADTSRTLLTFHHHLAMMALD